MTENTPGGIIALRLAPDQVVRAAGQQLALWGETVVSDRVARAAMRVQAMLGHEAVLRPVLGGGRNAGDQVTPIPFGEKTEPRLAAGRPWPGRVRGAAPGLVFPAAREADVTDDAGRAVTVSGRCAVSAAPARLAVRGEPPLRVTGWAGPWPLSERWWDPSAARRRARFQLATEDGRAWLAVVKDGRWLVEAGYWLGGLGQPAGPLAGAAAPDVLGDGDRAPAAGPRRRAARPPAAPRRGRPATIPWAELHCHSSFSFLDGAATPGELVAEAARLGLEVLALTDHDGMYGVPQFAQAAARLADRGGPKLGTVFGAELSLGLPGQPERRSPDPEGRHLLVLARDAEGYRRLCAVISAAQLAGGEKGRPVYDTAALADAHGGHWAVLTGCRKGAVPAALAAGGPEAAWRELAALTEMFGHENVMVELTCQHDPGDDERNDMLARLAALADLGVVATGNVHFAAPAQARLGQALAAIRARRSLADMDGWLPAAGTAYLRSGAEMAALLRRYPGVLERTVELGRACAFDFTVIAPRLPDFPVPAGHTEASWLRELIARKAPPRYGARGGRTGAWRARPDRQGARA